MTEAENYLIFGCGDVARSEIDRVHFPFALGIDVVDNGGIDSRSDGVSHFDIRARVESGVAVHVFTGDVVGADVNSEKIIRAVFRRDGSGRNDVLSRAVAVGVDVVGKHKNFLVVVAFSAMNFFIIGIIIAGSIDYSGRFRRSVRGSRPFYARRNGIRIFRRGIGNVVFKIPVCDHLLVFNFVFYGFAFGFRFRSRFARRVSAGRRETENERENERR